MGTRSQVNFRTDPEIDGMIEDIKQDIFNKTNIDMSTTQLFYKLIADAWEKCDTKNTTK